ncbi:MAG TPA: tetratricopeptide repeat protein [Burkholderiales bacterium]|nr:tetratricopeptide repeat protein [Burkholderiales bacterium]
MIAEGNRAEEAGDLETACERYRGAVQVAPHYAKAHLNLGIGLDAAGDSGKAFESYRAALALDPGDAYANYNLGRHLFLRSEFDQAESLLRKAIDGNPEFVDARVVLSRLLEQRKDFTGAAEELEKALRSRPGYLGALRNYADILLTLNRLQDAESALRRAAALDPNSFDTNLKLGSVLSTLQRDAEAERFFREAIRCNPDCFEARVFLVDAHLTRGELAQAANEAEAALKLRPGSTHLLFNYGVILKRLSRPEAETVFRSIIDLDATYARAYQMLAAVLLSQCRTREALDVFAQGRERCPDAFDLESPEIFALNCQDDISIDELFARHVDFGARLERQEPPRFGTFGNVPDPERRLRIGFISADFHCHVVTLFLIPLLEKRNRSAIEVYCYSTGDTMDEYTKRVRALSDVWHAVGQRPAGEISDLVHRDQVDILVDLAGHSGVPSLRVFAQRPAPVQATWLGYLNTTGLTRIQYRLTDNQCDPPGLTDRYHTEKLIRLPHSQWCYRPLVNIAAGEEVSAGKNGHVTFGSFNQIVKISPVARKLWGNILNRLPDSRLVVVGIMGDRAREDLLADFSNAGVDRNRITMVPFLPTREYFGWYREVDIALDTMPFSGGTTTCDALWMGVPVVTLPGVRPWSRSASSVLSMVGLEDWIATSPEDYAQRAIQFAGQPAILSELRTALRSRMLESPLMDEELFARDVENACRSMWKSWCERKEG